MIYGVAILSAASFVTVRGDCDPKCEPPLNDSFVPTSTAREFEAALTLGRCYSICTVAMVCFVIIM